MLNDIPICSPRTGSKLRKPWLPPIKSVGVSASEGRDYSREYTGLQRGKHVVVVVVSDPGPGERHWIITAYLTSLLVEGEVEWRRN